MTYDAGSHASPHFCWSEFRCFDQIHTPYPADWRGEPNATDRRGRDLAIELERIRAAVGHALDLDSVYRTKAHHLAVYKKLKKPAPMGSQHLHGRAADIRCPVGVPFAHFEACVLDVAGQDDSKIRYVKVYRKSNFIHIDIRPTEKLKVEFA